VTTTISLFRIRKKLALFHSKVKIRIKIKIKKRIKVINIFQFEFKKKILKINKYILFKLFKKKNSIFVLFQNDSKLDDFNFKKTTNYNWIFNRQSYHYCHIESTLPPLVASLSMTK
jgi:hypothetical protein